ncbi:substrate-binding domain-containing protein [Lactobacillus sp. R2/2]|nr:substrate-binding domain-containing protein [Lactobacillus sp. R2/2]
MDIPPEFVYSLNPTELMGDLPEFLRLDKKFPDALFCEDDYMALRLLKELTQRGIKIPEDIAIMGFDDIFEDTMVTPELTTIHVPITQIISQTINQLQSKVADRKWLPQKCFISTRLVKRKSL